MSSRDLDTSSQVCLSRLVGDRSPHDDLSYDLVRETRSVDKALDVFYFPSPLDQNGHFAADYNEIHSPRRLVRFKSARQPCRTAMTSETSQWKRQAFGYVVLLGGILTLGNLGTILHKSSRVYLFQQAQCLNYYRRHDATAIGPQYQIEEARCKNPVVQSRLSVVDGVDSFLQFLPREWTLLA